MTVLSEKSLARLKKFMDKTGQEAGPYYPTHGLILDWAGDPEYGGLPHPSAAAFADWLHGNWDDWCEEPETTVKEILEGAVTAWCGGRTM